jgi:hypothetical protein
MGIALVCIVHVVPGCFSIGLGEFALRIMLLLHVIVLLNHIIAVPIRLRRCQDTTAVGRMSSILDILPLVRGRVYIREVIA